MYFRTHMLATSCTPVSATRRGSWRDVGDYQLQPILNWMVISPLFFEIAAFLVGLLFGSFLNVCISRLPEHKSVNKPRSHCMACGKTIRWYDNVPLLSWLVLRGKCRDCGARISWRYPAVELAVGVLFLMPGLNLSQLQPHVLREIGLPLSAVAPNLMIPTIPFTILGFLLIGLIVMDWQTHTLPDAFTLTGTLIGFVLVFVHAAFLGTGEGDIHFDPQRKLRLSSPGSFVAKGDVFMTGPEHLVLGRLLAIVCAAGLLLLIRYVYKKLRGREGLGFGDAKLMAMIAAFLGFWPAMLALFLGVVLCSAYAITLLVRGRATAATQLPLGTFLSIGGLIAAVAGAPTIAWYSSLL
jgi:leader peptidase (prepilin peptidase)/N-methyltransferase